MRLDSRILKNDEDASKERKIPSVRGHFKGSLFPTFKEKLSTDIHLADMLTIPQICHHGEAKSLKLRPALCAQAT